MTRHVFDPSWLGDVRRLGISRATVARRMQDPQFRALVDVEREEVVEQARRKIARAAGGAVETLIDLAASARGEGVRLGAARAVVEIALSRRPGLNWIELSEFQRLAGEMIDAALPYVPVEERAMFLDAQRPRRHEPRLP